MSADVEALWTALTSRNTQRLVEELRAQGLRERLCRDRDPLPRRREEREADEAGMDWYGPL